MDLTNVETLINLDQPILENFGREKKSLALLALDCRLIFWIKFLALNLGLMTVFLVIPGEYGLPVLVRIAQFIF